jgi:hypothetical protein
VYTDSMSSKTGIPYIWNEHKPFTTTKKLVNPRTNRDTSWEWNAYRAVSIPPFAGICTF